MEAKIHLVDDFGCQEMASTCVYCTFKETIVLMNEYIYENSHISKLTCTPKYLIVFLLKEGGRRHGG